MLMDRGKRGMAMNKVKVDGNINQNPQSFLCIIPVQKEVCCSDKLQSYVHD